MHIQAAVDRLNSLLPLKARQEQLPPLLKHLHQAILESLIMRGEPLSNTEIAERVGADGVVEALLILGENDLVVLNAEGTAVVGAYPVTVEQTAHKLRVGANTIYAMCALDALSVATLFDTEVSIMSRCHVTAEAVEIHMRGFELADVKPKDVCVGIRWQMPAGVAAHSMCMEMVFLKDSEIARRWQGSDADSISIFNLHDAIRFGAAFFKPLLPGRTSS